MTKSAMATPGFVEGQVKTVNIEGSCEKKLTKSIFKTFGVQRNFTCYDSLHGQTLLH